MPIYQINIWICDICGKSYQTSVETMPFSDPIVEYPTSEKWEYVGKDIDEKLACPECLKIKEFNKPPKII